MLPRVRGTSDRQLDFICLERYELPTFCFIPPLASLNASKIRLSSRHFYGRFTRQSAARARAENPMEIKTERATRYNERAAITHANCQPRSLGQRGFTGVLSLKTLFELWEFLW
ncbi:hypothetical protein X777_02926 [Ooceraea biroi]|uniref:Uncharacterized protein n=1 Tax=Ooceraea biroi TaxID=2015173 RepID=A0A026WJT2_OOCBI|nr:hypothetical protein X777_02926 [Ooceraea biroi]